MQHKLVNVWNVLIVLCVFVSSCHAQAQPPDAANANTFFVDYDFLHASEPLLRLPPGDSEYTALKLERPLHFYGETYDQIFLSTNGILSFNVEYDEFINQPFPLEYPSIAPFYSNVDTSGLNENAEITIFATHTPEQLERASKLVQYAYLDAEDFEANELIVATWRNVGYYKAKYDKLNTFQVVLITSDDETYVQFIYPPNGLNWLQSETGELGLPDVRAQAGLISEDGRVFNLDGSGTDNVRFLSEGSNVGVQGVWLYRVGPLSAEQNAIEPSAHLQPPPTPPALMTCDDGGHKQCHLHAACHDQRQGGFCCACPETHYGNGRSCWKKDYPIRGSGSISGQLNNRHLDDLRIKLNSYVVTVDAHSYTALNPLSNELSSQLRLALPVFTVFGWLFAKPIKGELNGYQLTGGELQHTSKMRFDTGEVLIVNQTFEGLNYWDMLSVNVELYGEVPALRSDAKLNIPDYTEEYRFESPNELRSTQSHLIEVPEEQRAIRVDIEQNIRFERCLLDGEPDVTGNSVLQKVSKVMAAYIEHDQALRTSMFTKIGVDTDSNACTDGTANCGENGVCKPYEDTFRCECRHGYQRELNHEELVVCVDIDECALGTHVCRENGNCTNIEGGFECVYDDTTTPQPNFYGQDPETTPYEPSRINDNRHNYDNQRQDYDNGRQQYDYNRYDDYNRQEYDRQGQEYDRQGQEYDHQGQEYGRQDSTVNYQPTAPAPAQIPVPVPHQDDCYRCALDADCVGGRCDCREGFSGDGFQCTRICSRHDEVWENGQCVPLLLDDRKILPNCDFFGECTCPDGYELRDLSPMCYYIGHYAEEEGNNHTDELVPCDVDNNCHIHASCEWNDNELHYVCNCNNGYRGDGYHCESVDDSCATRPDICSINAMCNYVETIGKSECECNRGYEGDGFSCRIAAECQQDSHCGENAYCISDVCQCRDGYERDHMDKCQPADRCGGAICGANAFCQWDSRLSVQYCACIDGYEGDALQGCKSKPVSCNIRNNCGLHATCEPTEDPARYECQCNAGYHGDGYNCIEDQNCLNNPHMCDMNAKCLSTNSGLVCVCNPGFYGNGSVCLERQQHESGFLLVSQGVVIARVPLNGKNVRPIAVASMAIGLDKDCVEGRVYWGDISAKKIMSAKFDGTDSRAFITDDIESPEGIAIDVISRRLYWADSVKDTIEVASLDDPTLRAVLINKNLVNPRGIAIDPYHERLYWADWNREAPKIEISALDGTGREMLLDNNTVTLPNSLVVLDNSGELCYADAGTKKVECVDAYTKQVRTISNDLSYPFGLSYTQNQFFWTDWNTKKLESVDAFGNRQKGLQTPFYGSHKLYGMTAIEENCPQMGSPCQINNGGCADARLCLPNRMAPSGKSCKCTKLSQNCGVNKTNG